jgi:hypothetical protein
MEEREIGSIIKELEAGLKGKTARYLFENNLHQFIVEGNGPTFRIYLHHKFFEEEDPVEILNEFYKYHVIETLKKTTKPVWLYLSISGLQEVDENFVRQRPA